MQLIFANPEHTTIQATLEEGETLGNQHGPVTCFVPTDPANAEYAAILAGEYQIDPYVPPSPSPAVTITASAQSLQLSDARSLAAQGRTDEALTAVINILEGMQT